MASGGASEPLARGHTSVDPLVPCPPNPYVRRGTGGKAQTRPVSLEGQPQHKQCPRQPSVTDCRLLRALPQRGLERAANGQCDERG